MVQRRIKKRPEHPQQASFACTGGRVSGLTRFTLYTILITTYFK
ncbi:hypothetical protein [Paenibacillus sp. YIM B09110]